MDARVTLLPLLYSLFTSYIFFLDLIPQRFEEFANSSISVSLATPAHISLYIYVCI